MFILRLVLYPEPLDLPVPKSKVWGIQCRAVSGTAAQCSACTTRRSCEWLEPARFSGPMNRGNRNTGHSAQHHSSCSVHQKRDGALSPAAQCQTGAKVHTDVSSRSGCHGSVQIGIFGQDKQRGLWEARAVHGAETRLAGAAGRQVDDAQHQKWVSCGSAGALLPVAGSQQ